MAKKIKHEQEDDFGYSCCYYTCSDCGEQVESAYTIFCPNCFEKFDGYIMQDTRAIHYKRDAKHKKNEDE